MVTPTPQSETYQLELMDVAQKLGVAEFVRMLDEVDFSKMPVIYAFSDLIINFPFVDAFPVTFLEAAACERPLLSCSLPSYANTFAQKYFRMVDSDSVDGLAAAMVDFANESPEDRARNLKEARNFVQENFDEEQTIDEIINAYTRLSKRGAA